LLKLYQYVKTVKHVHIL